MHCAGWRECDQMAIAEIKHATKDGKATLFGYNSHKIFTAYQIRPQLTMNKENAIHWVAKRIHRCHRTKQFRAEVCQE